MTPKEKALDLISHFLWIQRKLDQLASRKFAIECAIIAVKELKVTEDAYLNNVLIELMMLKNE